MPPRWLCIGVIAFWLTTTGWLVWSEVRDDLDTDETPPFVIDLPDEFQSDQNHVTWLLFWQGEDLQKASKYGAETSIEHRESDDTFALIVDYPPPKGSSIGPLEFGKIELNRMRNTYRVNRAGRMLATKADLDFDYVFDLPEGNKLTVAMTVAMHGEVRGDQFYSAFEISRDGVALQEQELSPVPVSRRGAVLLPLHPVNKIRGLHLGQSWKMPFVDPLADALAAYVGSSPERRTLRAHVRPELEMLPILPESLVGPMKLIPCFVIDYDGDVEGKPQTWVRAADGLVLRQDAELFGKHLVMLRHLIP